MKKDRSKKLFPVWTIIATFLAVLILFVSFNLTKQKQNLSRLANEQPVYPIEVKVVNQSDSSFSVSWATKDAVNGFIVYGQNRDEVVKNDYQTPKVADRRGEGNYYTHLVTISNLETGRTYFFKISDPNFQYLQTLDNEWREVGIAGSVTLPGNPGRNLGSFSLESEASDGCNGLPPQNLSYCFRPNPVWGQLRQQDNQVAKDALIFIDVPGQSNVVATKTDENGRWVMDISNLWKNDWTDYLPYNPGIDLIRVSALAKDAMTSTYRPISKVGAEQEQKTSPINLVLQDAPFVVRENTPTPTPIISIAPTITPTPSNQPVTIVTINPNKVEMRIYFSLKNSDKLTSKIELKNKAGRRQTKTIVFTRQSDGWYKSYFDFNTPDEYEILVKPDGCLSTSLGKFVLRSGINRLDAGNTTWLAGDINNDDKINILDVGLLLAKYQTIQKTPTGADLNADGMINSIDLSLLLGNYYGN